jgi:hypothetical protein
MELLIILSLANNTILDVILKWNLIERYDLYKKKWMPDFCPLCLFFWLGFFEFELSGYNILSSFYHGLAISALSRIIYEIYHYIQRN